MGNVRGVQSALQAVGAQVEVSEEVGGRRLVLPGAGAFAEAVERLGPRMDALRAYEGDMLGIGQGMNLMFTCHVDHTTTDGLALFEGEAVPMPRPHGTVPNMGWHALHGLGDPFVYFAHSVGVAACPHATATFDHGRAWVAAVQKGRHTGFQFNPEKSGKAGLMLLHAHFRA